MKLSVKLLSLLLALLMLLSTALLTACEKTDTPGTDDTTTESGADVPPEGPTTDAPAADLVLIADGKSNCRVIRYDDLDNSDAVVSSASTLRNHISTKTKVTPDIDTDWKKPTDEYDHDSVEILVGYTDYSESQEALSQIGYGDYIVKIIGRKLVVVGYTDSATALACTKLQELIDSLATEGSLTIPGDTLITGTVNEMLNALPEYESGTFSSAFSSGNDGDQVLIKNTTSQEYSAYVNKLNEAGFTTYTTNTITENSFATLTNADYTVNIGYYDYEKSTRIIIEPLAEPVGLKEDNTYTAVTTSQITMFGLEYNSDNTIGLSMLIRLTDGRFIVIDGGFTARASEDAQLLVNALKEQSKGYLKSGEKITIAAWIITHAHGDHSGMIEKAYAKFKSMKVERFLVNFLAPTELAKAMNSTQYGSNFASNNATKWRAVIVAAQALGATVQYVRVGQVFYMADVTMEILYTIDSFAPKLCNAFNTTSLIIKFTFGDGTTFMMTGDATGNAFQIAAKMYGSYLKSDILQVSHHGCSTWNNDAGTISAYKLISPATLLWPRGHTKYSSYKAKSYNLVLYPKSEGGLNDSYKEHYIAGYEGESVTVPIPYQVGNAIVVRK